MGVTFKNTPKGNVVIAKSVTDGKTKNVMSERTTQQTVEMPTQAGMALVTELKPFAEVNYSAGFTKGLPNYSAARVDISLKLPCDVDNIDETLRVRRGLGLGPAAEAVRGAVKPWR